MRVREAGSLRQRRDAGPLRVGLIGCGAIASAVHLRLLRRMPGAVLVGVADPDAEARGRAQRIGRVPAVADAGELLGRDDLDAVVVCTPSERHAELAVAAAEAGKHVYLEKPLATSASDAAAVAAAVTRAGVLAVVGFNRRFHPLFEQARRLLRAGSVGRVRAVQTSFCEPATVMPDWKRRRASGGGVLLDLASHHFDLVRWLLADEIERVEASLASELSEDDTAWVHLALARGAEVQSFFSFRTGRADVLQLLGDQGVLQVDRYAARLRLSAAQAGRRGSSGGPAAPTPASAAWRLRHLVQPLHDPSYRLALGAFVASLAGQNRELPTVDDGVRSLEAVLAAERSAQAGAPVVPGRA